MKAPRRNPVKTLAGFLLAYGMLFLAGLFLFIGAFIWLSKMYGTEAAFAAVGGTLLLFGLIILLMLNRPKKAVTPLPHKISQDPLAKYVPDNVRDNPTVQKLLHQIGENPVTATATAVTVGMLLSRELMEE